MHPSIVSFLSWKPDHVDILIEIGLFEFTDESLGGNVELK